MKLGFIEVGMNETAKVVAFCLVVMPLAMTAYMWAGIDTSLAARRHLTTVAPVAMGFYLCFVFSRDGERHLQNTMFVAVTVLALIALFAAQVSDDMIHRTADIRRELGLPPSDVPSSWTIAWRAMVFGGHVLVLLMLAAWYWQRPGRGAAFCWALVVAMAAQTFNVAEYGLCNYGAAEISLADASRSVCVRRVGSPLYWLVPLIVVYGMMGQALAARR